LDIVVVAQQSIRVYVRIILKCVTGKYQKLC